MKLRKHSTSSKKIKQWNKCYKQTKPLNSLLHMYLIHTKIPTNRNKLKRLRKADLFFLDRSLFSLILRPPPSVVLLAPAFHLSGTITFDSFFSPANQNPFKFRRKFQTNKRKEKENLNTKEHKSTRRTKGNYTSRTPSSFSFFSSVNFPSENWSPNQTP